MLADSIEAIAKGLHEPTSARFREIAKEMIRKRIFDGQLDECHLTMADLYKIEESFEATLAKIYRGRVEYPDTETALQEGEDKVPPPESESGAEAKLEAN